MLRLYRGLVMLVETEQGRPIGPLAAGLATGVLAVSSTFATDDGPVLCLFRICTGGYCPGCGGSRAMVSLIRGDLGGAWAQHPWAVLIAVQLVLGAVVAVTPLRSRASGAVRPVLIANAVFGVGLWVLRMGVGQIPVPFG